MPNLSGYARLFQSDWDSCLCDDIGNQAPETVENVMVLDRYRKTVGFQNAGQLLGIDGFNVAMLTTVARIPSIPSPSRAFSAPVTVIPDAMTTTSDPSSP
ncbi:MAG: hypothetical protein M0C28_31965 [Candidatus Moduliflexus flocculans]|nr:hypothetical protein [Candidatus Moduliflexus flocculans]